MRAFSMSESQMYHDGLDLDNEMPAHTQQLSACHHMFQRQTGALSGVCACPCVRQWCILKRFGVAVLCTCVEKHSHSQQTKPYLSTSCYSETGEQQTSG